MSKTRTGPEKEQHHLVKNRVSLGITGGYPAWNGYMERDEFSTTFVHQLVLVAKGEDPYKVYSGGEYQCHHKNGVKWDNRPKNLELVTRGEHYEIHKEETIEALSSVNRKEYTREDCIEWLHLFVEEFGVPPTQNDILGWPGPSPAVYEKRFDSWNTAVEAAGYTPRRYR